MSVKIENREPINKLARVVVTFKGDSFTTNKKAPCPHWEEKPPTVIIKSGWRNKIGYSVGRMKVVGLYNFFIQNQEGRGPRTHRSWLVRCCCGRYEVRKDKTVNNPQLDDCCYVCKDVRSSSYKNGYGIKRTYHGKPAKV